MFLRDLFGPTEFDELLNQPTSPETVIHPDPDRTLGSDHALARIAFATYNLTTVPFSYTKPHEKLGIDSTFGYPDALFVPTSVAQIGWEDFLH